MYFFIHPNNIGSAQQQPRHWGSPFNFSESGRGSGRAQLFIISFATTRLHGICNGGNNGMEDEGGGGPTRGKIGSPQEPWKMIVFLEINHLTFVK